jgi:hypothetical protein
MNDLITYNKALKGPNSDKWQQAIKKEFNDLKAQNTWTLTKLLAGRKALKIG